MYCLTFATRCLSVTAVLAACTITQAALITPIGVVSANNVDGSAPLVNLINHSGLSPTTLEHAAAFSGNHWRTTTAPGSVTLTFDLGAKFSLDGTYIWNYNESGTGGGGAANTNRGFQSFDISFSTDNVTFTGTQSISLAQAPGTANYLGEFDALLGTVDARYVRFDNVTSYGSNNGFTGLSEVRFNAVNPILSPSTTVNQNANGGGAFGIENLTNNDGMTGAGLELAVPATGANGFDGQWRQLVASGNTVSNSEITFDFGAETEIGIVKIWNYSETGTTSGPNGTVNTTTRGLSEIELFQSDDGITYSSLGVFSLLQAPQVNHTQHNVIDLSGLNVHARFIRLDANAIFDANNGFYGLGEVRFFGVVVPEPATAMLGIFGLTALARRRRRLA